MGTYLNPGKKNYEIAVNSEIYVDKTVMIPFLNTVINTQQRYVCVSRPRRFGKTMAADMICAYYDREAESRDLFSQRKLANCTGKGTKSKVIPWDAYLGKFDVIRLVMTEFMEDSNSVREMISYLTEEVVDELRDKYSEIYFGNRINLRTVMNKIYSATQRQFVIVIDEWDAIFRTWKDNEEGQTKYLDFLRDWMKDKPYIALAYMTGILPIKKHGRHSALNMFDEYSMISPMQLAPYTAFTEEEVSILCHQYGRDYEKIKEWYDGYKVSDILPPNPGHELTPVPQKYTLYSPLSVVKAIQTGWVMNYWNKTETYEALAHYIRRDYDGLKDAIALLMDGGRLKIDTSTYQNDVITFHGRDDILSLLIHLGYLGFDAQLNEVFIPNREILDEFKSSTKSGEWEEPFRAYEKSKELLKATCRPSSQAVGRSPQPGKQ